MTSNIIRTWNDAVSLSTPDPTTEMEGRISLFFKGLRGIEENVLYKYMEKSFNEDIIDTIIISFYIRDCRGGKGERDIGRNMLKWLFINHPIYFEKVMHFIPIYGRWDDILIFFPNTIDVINETHIMIQYNIINLLISQLNTDYMLMNKGEPISIAAKWAPTEGNSDDKKYKLVKSICKQMNINERTYRTKYITPMREYLKVVERLMCSNKWDKIDFNKVPSCAMYRLKKAFEKHVPYNFENWKESLKNNTSVVKAKQLYPHNLIKEIRKKQTYDIVVEEQWKVLEKEVKKYGKFSNTVCVVDVSHSMTMNDSLPLDMSCGIGLLISNIVEGDFHNTVITFEEKPSFIKINDGTLFERYNQIKNISWGGSTNLQAVFDIILSKSEEHNLSDEDSPDTIIIISDMQFDNIEQNNNTNFDEIESKYASYNRKRPKIIFWNVNGLSTDFPVTIDDNGTVMLSGASPSALKSVLSSSKFDSVSILKETLYSDRYKQIRDIFQKI